MDCLQTLTDRDDELLQKDPASPIKKTEYVSPTSQGNRLHWIQEERCGARHDNAIYSHCPRYKEPCINLFHGQRIFRCFKTCLYSQACSHVASFLEVGRVGSLTDM